MPEDERVEDASLTDQDVQLGTKAKQQLKTPRKSMRKKGWGIEWMIEAERTKYGGFEEPEIFVVKSDMRFGN